MKILSKFWNQALISSLMVITLFLNMDIVLYLSYWTSSLELSSTSSDTHFIQELTDLFSEQFHCKYYTDTHPCNIHLAKPEQPSYHLLHKVDNAPLAIVIITSNITRPAFNLSIQNKLAYAKHQGYSLVVTPPHLLDRSPQWSKMGAILHAFDLNHPLVWMLDVDTIITNFSIPIHQLPNAFTDPNLTLFIPRDCNNLNTGSWLLKNTPWTHYFLNQIHQAYGVWKLKEPTWCEQQVLIDFYSMFPSVKARIQELPDWTLNLYPPECPDSIPRPWVNGDFLLHFAGLMHGEDFDDLYLAYYQAIIPELHSEPGSFFNQTYWFELIQQSIRNPDLPFDASKAEENYNFALSKKTGRKKNN